MISLGEQTIVHCYFVYKEFLQAVPIIWGVPFVLSSTSSSFNLTLSFSQISRSGFLSSSSCLFPGNGASIIVNLKWALCVIFCLSAEWLRSRATIVSVKKFAWSASILYATPSASSRIRFLPVQAQPTAARSSRRARSRTVVTLGDIFT